MFQEFRTHAYFITVLIPIWIYAYAFFFGLNFVFVFFSVAIQRFDFKNNIIAIKFDFVVAVL